MWGALSPTQNVNRSLADELATAEKKLKAEEAAKPVKQEQQQQASSKRNIGQAEIESSLYKVGDSNVNLIKLVTRFVCFFSTTVLSRITWRCLFRWVMSYSFRLPFPWLASVL